SVTPSFSSCGRFRPRKRSMPGLASPIEFNMPTSVSAMRTGWFPSRGSGVTVLVTKASRLRATAGATSASRQPEALSSTEPRSFDPEPLQLATDLDRAAVARTVAAGHRGFPRELCFRCDGAHRFEHGLRPAREDVEAGRDQLCGERGLHAHLR